MTDPLQISPDGVNGYAVTVDDHAGHVVTVSIPPGIASAAMSQNSGQATAALHAITAMIGLAMGRELNGVGDNTKAGTNRLVAQDDENSARLAQVGGHQGLGDAVKLGDILSPLGTLAGAAINGASTFGNGALQNLTNVGNAALQSLTQVGTHSIDHPGVTAGIGGDAGKDEKSSGSTGAVTRPASGTSQPSFGAPVAGSGGVDRPNGQQREERVNVPAGSPMPFGSSGIGGGAAPTGKVVQVTKRVVTKQDQERAES